MAIRNELIEELLAGQDPKEVFSQDGLLDELKKVLAERILMPRWISTWHPSGKRKGPSRATIATATAERPC